MGEVLDFDPSGDELEFERIDEMKWTRPEHGPSKITAAGKIISGRKKPSEHMTWDDAFTVAANWRSAHGYPLHALSITLRNRARAIDPKSLVAQRLKRMPSVLAKLRRFNGMQLSQMQDLGGCRAVLFTVDEVDELVSLYEHNPIKTACLCERYDYIESPKADGYRGVHMVYSYKSNNPNRLPYNGLRVEVQIRSIYQHAWATAVETIDTFTRQGLKGGAGGSDWRRLFILVSSYIAILEGRPLVGNPLVGELLRSDNTWFAELENLIRSLRVREFLTGLRQGLEIAIVVPAASTYILILDSDARTTHVDGFDNEELAARRYLEIERESIDNPSLQAVMVSVDSIEALRDAYPNYYLDTARFVAILENFLAGLPRAAERADSFTKALNEAHGSRKAKSRNRSIQ